MRSPFEIALARWRQTGLPKHRRRQDVVFVEPQLPGSPGQGREGSGGLAGPSAADVFFASAALDATTSTREVVERQTTVDLFGELNTAAEKFVRAHRRSQGMDQRGEQVAHVIADVADAVFGEAWDVGAEIRTSLGLASHARHLDLEDLVNRGHVLRKQISQSRALEVCRTAVPGSQLDPIRQKPWKSSVPSAPIRFLVFPGLSSCGHVLVKQQVYTMSLREAQEHGHYT